MCPIPLSNVFVLIFRSDVHKGDDQVPHFTVSIYYKEVLFASAHIYTVVINGVHVCIFHLQFRKHGVLTVRYQFPTLCGASIIYSLYGSAMTGLYHEYLEVD